MKRKFIINARAGRRGRGRVDALRERFAATAGGFDFVVPADRADTAANTRRSLHEGYDQIVAVGGDGTINAVVNGFFEAGVAINPLACLSVADAGTGSDYARAVYGQAHADWLACVETFVPRNVDLGRVTYLNTTRAPVLFANMASIGMSAAVVQRKLALPRFVPSALAYALPALASLFATRPFHARLTFDEQTHEGEILNLFATKGVTAGGGMRLGGSVTLEDGRFDVTVIKGMGLLRSLPRFARLFSGVFDDDRYFIKTTASRIVVSTQEPHAVEMDGEVEGVTDVELSVMPGALRLAAPPASP